VSPEDVNTWSYLSTELADQEQSIDWVNTTRQIPSGTFKGVVFDIEDLVVVGDRRIFDSSTGSHIVPEALVRRIHFHNLNRELGDGNYPWVLKKSRRLAG